MSDTNQLERIKGLADRLTPLADKTRGMRIEAEQWNTLVEVLRGILDIDRTQENVVTNVIREECAPKDHQHLGQVGMDWLDTETRARLTGGGGAVSRPSLDDVHKKIEGLTQEVRRLAQAVEEQQKALDRLAVNHIDWRKELFEVRNRFQGFEDVRVSVANLTKQVGDVSKTTGEVLQLRSRLTDEQGKPIDFVKMRGQLDEVKTLRAALVRDDGTLIRPKEIETQVKGLNDLVSVIGKKGGATAAVAPDDLDKRLTTISTDLETRIGTRFDTRLRDIQKGLEDEHATVVSNLQTQFVNGFREAKTGLEETAKGRLDEAEKRLGTRFDDQLRVTADRLSKDVSAASARTIEDKLVTLVPTHVNQEVGRRRDELETTLRGALTAHVNGVVETQVGKVGGELGKRVTTVETLATTLKTELPQRVRDQVATEKVSLLSEVNANVDEKLAKTSQFLTTSLIPARVSEVVKTTVGDLDTRIGATLEQKVADLDSRIDDVVSKRTRNLSSDVSREVETRLTALNLTAQLNAVQTRVNTVEQSVVNLNRDVSEQKVNVVRLQGDIQTTKTAPAGGGAVFNPAGGKVLKTK